MPRRKQPEFSNAETKRLKATLAELETLVWNRKDQKAKRYTFEEMYALVPTYQSARIRPEHSRLLTFDELMTLCDYLDCSVTEKNLVLERAQYQPILRFVSGEELHAALEAARAVLAYLPIPAYVLTQDWHIQAWNPYILKLLGWSDGQARSLQLNGRLSVLHLIFDTNLGLRTHLAGEDGTWSEMAFRNVYTFKTINWLYRHDPWFIQELDRLMKLPDFLQYWEMAQINMAQPQIKAEFVSQISFPDERIFRFRSLFVSNGSFYYPHVAAYMPLDEPSCEILRSRGIPVLSDIISG